MARAIPTILLFLALLTTGVTSWAVTVSAAARAEIDHLLGYVRQSGCQFDRNGTWHDPGNASEHLAKKQRYLEERGQLASAEDFIVKAATKSSMTGKTYQVRCGSGPAVASAEWLMAELQRFRLDR